MKIAVLKERSQNETRVAATPETVKKLTDVGHQVLVESGAGLRAGYVDSEYEAHGGKLAKTSKAAMSKADIVFKIHGPSEKELADYPKGIALLGLLDPFGTAKAMAKSYAERHIMAFSMELTPRITRAQAMDALSSQSNLAGYRAVIEGAKIYGRAMPMMMTAAGTVAPARVFIMGAGVAGLQAIATARRLGGVVSATDVRPAAKEQVASLGGKFIAVEDEEFKAAETAGGYAKEMSAEYQAKQAELIASHIAKQDMVITTALIPGRPAPTLVSEEMVTSMRPGSVIIDMAVAQGGNCPLSKPDEIVDVEGVKIAGYTNLPALIAADASSLYAKNLLAFLPLVTSEAGDFAPNMEDEIIKANLLTHEGEIIHPILQSDA